VSEHGLKKKFRTGCIIEPRFDDLTTSIEIIHRIGAHVISSHSFRVLSFYDLVNTSIPMSGSHKSIIAVVLRRGD
jgi:hypothetical protein